MEAKLASKLDANNKAVNEAVSLSKQTNEALEAVEEKVKANDAALRAVLQASEERMMARFQDTVKDMVLDQLRAAGFDPDLSASALTMPALGESLRAGASASAGCPSYVAMVAAVNKPDTRRNESVQIERREDRFWECRRSLHLWPVRERNREGLENFLRDKLRMNERFIDEDLGPTTIRKNKDLKAKNKDCLLYTSPSPRDRQKSRMPSSA